LLPRQRATALTRRARERPAQDLADPPKLSLLPWRAGQLAKAIHVLQIREANAGRKGSLSPSLIRFTLVKQTWCYPRAERPSLPRRDSRFG
jgi:hypothetical protein